MTSRSRPGVLLLAYGGPRTLDEVPSFLESILGPRATEEMIERLLEKYAAIGGGSPLVSQTEDQAREVKDALAGKVGDIPVEVGYRHVMPTIADAVEKLLSQDVQRIIAVIMNPFRSEHSSEKYIKELSQAAERLGAGSIRLALPFGAAAGYIESLASRVSDVMAMAEEAGDISTTSIVFTAHSVPDDPIHDALAYDVQFKATADAVSETLSTISPGLKYARAFQSARRYGSWLGPDVGEMCRDLLKAGDKTIIIAPIGFVCEHVETLYDLDITVRAIVDKAGGGYYRAKAVQTHPAFIGMIADAVRQLIDVV